jgi:hypothetical protein
MESLSTKLDKLFLLQQSGWSRQNCRQEIRAAAGKPAIKNISLIWSGLARFNHLLNKVLDHADFSR